MKRIPKVHLRMINALIFLCLRALGKRIFEDHTGLPVFMLRKIQIWRSNLRGIRQEWKNHQSSFGNC
jgi:hypothetical protein